MTDTESAVAPFTAAERYQLLADRAELLRILDLAFIVVGHYEKATGAPLATMTECREQAELVRKRAV